MSLIKVRIPAKAAAADASEIQRVEKLLGRELTDREFWKLGDYVMKNLKAGKSFTDAELLKAVKDCADSAANYAAAGAQDAKFKVGQRVKIDRKDATITKTNAEGQWNYYYFKFDGDPRERGIFESEISANSRAQDADIREPKVGDVLKYYHPRTGKYVGKVKVVNIHRHSDAKWDAQYECEYLDGELKGGRFRDEGGENISFT